MRSTRLFLAANFLALCLSVSSCAQSNKDVLFQTSTMGALLEGVYDGVISCEELTQRGDLGIGTFDGLDGEMVMLDGDIYQIKADGIARAVERSVKTPFAVVTFFEPDKVVCLDEPVQYRELQDRLDSVLPTKNIFYAFKMEGVFRYVKTRSVPRQMKPYPPLADVVRNQPTFEFRDVKGTIVGFRLPDYMEGINVPGYHLHFISADRKGGGHLLECRVENVRIEIDDTSEFHMVLPKHGDFYRADLERARETGAEKAVK